MAKSPVVSVVVRSLVQPCSNSTHAILGASIYHHFVQTVEPAAIIGVILSVASAVVSCTAVGLISAVLAVALTLATPVNHSVQADAGGVTSTSICDCHPSHTVAALFAKYIPIDMTSVVVVKVPPKASDEQSFQY